MKRLAWFTPLPPERSGIATYSSEILGLLTDVYDVDIIVDSLPVFIPFIGFVQSNRTGWIERIEHMNVNGVMSFRPSSNHSPLYEH